MESLISFSAAAMIVALALALLVLAVSMLGKALGVFAAMEVMALVTLKFAVLALGIGWMSRQPWFRAPAAAFGIAIPLTALIVWKGRSVKMEKNHA